jgi:hypothetical protein
MLTCVHCGQVLCDGCCHPAADELDYTSTPEQIAAALEAAVELVANRFYLRAQPSSPQYDGDRAALLTLQTIADRARWKLVSLGGRP